MCTKITFAGGSAPLNIPDMASDKDRADDLTGKAAMWMPSCRESARDPARAPIQSLVPTQHCSHSPASSTTSADRGAGKRQGSVPLDIFTLILMM